MNKKAKILFVLIALCASFMIGWRVMPRVWPGFRLNVINRLIPQLAPASNQETEEERPLYTPKSDTQYGDPISTDDSLIYYFYKDYCHYCMELEPLMAGIPKEITLPDGRTSRVRLVCLNKVEEEYARIIAGYYEENNVSEDRQYVPAVVIGDRYLFLHDEIVAQLMDALIAGEGLETKVLDGVQRDAN